MTGLFAQTTTKAIAWLTFFVVILVAWLWLYSASTGMGLDLLGRPGEMARVMMASGVDNNMAMANFGTLAGMWVVMMAAMMLPTMVPTLAVYDDLISAADGTRAGWFGVLAGYFLTWVAFAVVIAGIQFFALHLGALNLLGQLQSSWLASGLLIVVGAYQFSSIKSYCHHQCHSPMGYFISNWQPGSEGGLNMGLHLGIFCVGCCWGYMALGFVGGVMNLSWMGIATFFMVLEKIPQIGMRVTRPVGVGMILFGLALPLISGT